MTKFTYTPKTGSLKEFILEISSRGIPQKITQSYIYSVGFKTSNDRPIIQVLKFIGFLDDTGTPTQKFKDYRDKEKSNKILGNAIKKAYKLLYEIYNNAHEQDIATLLNYFSTAIGLAEGSVRTIADTFKALSSIADFGTTNHSSDTKNIHSEEENIDNIFEPSTNKGITIIVNSTMGKNKFNAKTKEDFKQLRKDLEKIWDAIEIFWKEDNLNNNHSGTEAKEINANLSGSNSLG